MPALRRRALAAAAVSAVLFTPVAADAACVEHVCVHMGEAPSIGELITSVDPDLPDVDGGPGQICLYQLRSENGPPPGYSGGPAIAGVYVWQQSWEWGQRYPEAQGYWDSRQCPPLQCKQFASLLDAAVTCDRQVG